MILQTIQMRSDVIEANEDANTEIDVDAIIGKSVAIVTWAWGHKTILVGTLVYAAHNAPTDTWWLYVDIPFVGIRAVTEDCFVEYIKKDE